MFSSDDRRDIHSACTFILDYDEDEAEDIVLTDIVKYEFLYNGITPHTYADENYGLTISDDGYLSGYPTPIIRFWFKNKIDSDQFLSAIAQSSMNFSTNLQRKVMGLPSDGLCGWFFEDHNGYTEAITPEQADEWISLLRERNVFCGKSGNVEELISGFPLSKLL